MRVLVTGATGRIGRNLVKTLRANNATVSAVALESDPGIEQLVADGIPHVVGNLSDPDVCERATQGIDAIVHLGAMLLFGPNDNPALMNDNIRATFNLLESASRNKDLKRFVLASSDEVYPSLYAKYQPIDESHPTEPYSFYGVTKLTNEEMVRFYLRSANLPGAIARFALTIEPWEVLHPDRPLGNFLHVSSMVPFLRNRSGDEIADQLERRIEPGQNPLLLARDENGVPYLFHYCDVRDLVQGLLLLLTHESAVGEAFNLSGPAPFSYDQAVTYLASKTGQPIVDAHIPGPPIRIHHSTAKARGMLGYRPQHDIFSTIDSAIESELAGLTQEK